MAVSFKFEEEGDFGFGRIFRPIAKVKLTAPSINISVNIWMVVDTGADYTILPRHFSEKLRISLKRDCRKDYTSGVGGNQSIYFYKEKLTAQIGEEKRRIPLAFFDNNEVPALMGRLGFLETFDTQFLKSHTVVFK